VYAETADVVASRGKLEQGGRALLTTGPADAITHKTDKRPRLTKQDFILRAPVSIAAASGLLVRIRLRFHKNARQLLAIGLALHQQAADQLGGHFLAPTGEEGYGEDWQVLDERGGYRSG
jgi:hypothetical protein